MTSNLPMNAQFNDINEDIISVFDGSTKMKQRNRHSMSIQRNLIFFWWTTRPTILVANPMRIDFYASQFKRSAI